MKSPIKKHILAWREFIKYRDFIRHFMRFMIKFNYERFKFDNWKQYKIFKKNK